MYLTTHVLQTLRPISNAESAGLRKAAGMRMAELGCSTNEIAAILGHDTLKEVERYTKAARQKRLAANAGDRIENKNSQPFR